MSQAFPHPAQSLMVFSGVSQPSVLGASVLQSPNPGLHPVYSQVKPPPSAATHVAPTLLTVSQTTPHAPQLVGDVFDVSQPFVLGGALSQSSQPLAHSRYVHRLSPPSVLHAEPLLWTRSHCWSQPPQFKIVPGWLQNGALNVPVSSPVPVSSTVPASPPLVASAPASPSFRSSKPQMFAQPVASATTTATMPASLYRLAIFERPLASGTPLILLHSPAACSIRASAAPVRYPRAMSAKPQTLVVDNPFTGEPACEVELADGRVASGVLDRARDAARAWRTSPLADRIALCERAMAAMEARAEAIAADITRMMGKPLGQARGEVKTTAARARYMMSIAEAALADVVLPLDGFERRIVREPLGVVLDLPAWNYPLLTAVNCVVPAVLAGNAVIVKHSPRTPLCGEHFARAFADAGAPPSLVQALNCDHAQSERLVADERVDHVVFTGSIFGGHRMVEAATKRFLHPCLELGGNDPAYVAPDCDLAKTVENVVDGAIYNAGQSCCAVERVYVHKSVYGRFVELAETLVRAYVMGDPTAAETTLGPIAQRLHVAELEGFVSDARSRGGARHRGRTAGEGRRARALLRGDAPGRRRPVDGPVPQGVVRPDRRDGHRRLRRGGPREDERLAPRPHGERVDHRPRSRRPLRDARSTTAPSS